jgi:Bacterial toxin 44
MKNKEIQNSFIVATTGVSILQTAYLKEYNPDIKMMLGILPGVFLSRSKNPYIKYWGDSLIAGSIIGYTINKLAQDVCDYSYNKNLPKRNSVLVNINTGKVIENIGKPHFIFVTKNYGAIEGWQSSSPLLHCIKKLEGKAGGRPSKQGDPVLWDNLQDHTEKFNQLLKYWTKYFSALKPAYENNYKQKLLFWYSMVNDYKHLDIKRKKFHPSAVSEWSIYNNTLVRYDDYGNILYGAAGTAFGISRRDLFFGANINQIVKSGLDESKDTFSIQRGINIYNNSIVRKQVSNTMDYV